MCPAPWSSSSPLHAAPGIGVHAGLVPIVTEGKGLNQCEGGTIVEIDAGDIICCPPDHRHWHSVTPTTAMAHIAIQGAQDGKVVEWVEKVTDEEYLVGPVS